MQVNYAIVLWTETDTIVLPPGTVDTEGRPTQFYVDPPGRPGLHRDLFRQHAQKMLGRLLVAGFVFSPSMLKLAPPECAAQVAEAMAEAGASAAAARS